MECIAGRCACCSGKSQAANQRACVAQLHRCKAGMVPCHGGNVALIWMIHLCGGSPSSLYNMYSQLPQTMYRVTVLWRPAECAAMHRKACANWQFLHVGLCIEAHVQTQTAIVVTWLFLFDAMPTHGDGVIRKHVQISVDPLQSSRYWHSSG